MTWRYTDSLLIVASSFVPLMASSCKPLGSFDESFGKSCEFMVVEIK